MQKYDLYIILQNRWAKNGFLINIVQKCVFVFLLSGHRTFVQGVNFDCLLGKRTQTAETRWAGNRCNRSHRCPSVAAQVHGSSWGRWNLRWARTWDSHGGSRTHRPSRRSFLRRSRAGSRRRCRPNSCRNSRTASVWIDPTSLYCEYTKTTLIINYYYDVWTDPTNLISNQILTHGGWNPISSQSRTQSQPNLNPIPLSNCLFCCDYFGWQLIYDSIVSVNIRILYNFNLVKFVTAVVIFQATCGYGCSP